MAPVTEFTKRFGVRHPIALAAVDLIHDRPPAAGLVPAIAAQAEDALARAGRA